MLPLPRITIMADEVKLGTIIQAFQDLRYIGELRQRWDEIKKLQNPPMNSRNFDTSSRNSLSG